MIRVVDVSLSKQTEDQINLIKRIGFTRIKAHPNLFVVDVTDEDLIFLTLMGIREAREIFTDYDDLKIKNGGQYLFEDSDGQYVIVNVNGTGTSPK